MSEDWETDVVVVGAGGAGLVAALAAAEQGAQVILLEKGRAPGGNTARSGGMIMAPGTRFQRAAGIEEAPEGLVRDVFHKNGHQSDPAVTTTLCAVSRELVEWLVDSLGVRLLFVDDFKYPGHSQFRMHAPPTRSGQQLVDDLLDAVARHPNITLLCQSAVEGLHADAQGGAAGVLVRTQGQELLLSKRVILACNGFGGNKQMLQRYIPEMVGALYYGCPGNTGEGIRWGMALGADVACMDAYQAHASVVYPHATLLPWPVIVHGGFVVNRQGRRFANEDMGYSAFAAHVLRQEEGLGYAIFDQWAFEHTRSFAAMQESIEAGALRGPAGAAELARSLGINADGLQQALSAYNAAMAGATTDPLGRAPSRPLGESLFGVPITGSLFHTQGGLRVNTSAQVLDKAGRPIPNLYAAGGTAAGISGNGADGYTSGNGLLSALGLGLMAGRHAAAGLRSGAA